MRVCVVSYELGSQLRRSSDSVVYNIVEGYGRRKYKADFIRLRNLTIGYSLPKTTLNTIGMSNVRFYLTGVNLLTFTDYSGYDPEARRDDTGVGEEFYSAPPSRTIALGVNLNF